MTSGLIIYSRRGRRGGRGAAWKIERAWGWMGLAIDPGQEFQGLHGHSQTRVHNYRPRSALTLVLGLIINLLRGLISATRCGSFGDRTPRFRRYVLSNGRRSRPRRLRSTLFGSNISNVASSLSRAFCKVLVPRETSRICPIVAILNESFLWQLPRLFLRSRDWNTKMFGNEFFLYFEKLNFYFIDNVTYYFYVGGPSTAKCVRRSR